VKQIAHMYLGGRLNLFKLHPPSSQFLLLATHTYKKSINSLGFKIILRKAEGEDIPACAHHEVVWGRGGIGPLILNLGTKWM